MDVDGLPEIGYAVVRCCDRCIIAKFHSFPECDRALMYRRGDTLSFAPLLPEEIVGTPNLFSKMFDDAIYPKSQLPDKLISS